MLGGNALYPATTRMTAADVRSRMSRLSTNEVSPQRRFLIERARQQSVEPVREGSDNQNGKRYAVPAVMNGNNKKRQEPESQERELIWNSEDAGRHFFGFYCSSDE